MLVNLLPGSELCFSYVRFYNAVNRASLPNLKFLLLLSHVSRMEQILNDDMLNND